MVLLLVVMTRGSLVTTERRLYFSKDERVVYWSVLPISDAPSTTNTICKPVNTFWMNNPFCKMGVVHMFGCVTTFIVLKVNFSLLWIKDP
jgi:hypothetical protein